MVVKHPKQAGVLGGSSTEPRISEIQYIHKGYDLPLTTQELPSNLETVVVCIFIDIELPVFVECMCEVMAFRDFSYSIDRNQMGGTKNAIEGDNVGFQRVGFTNNP